MEKTLARIISLCTRSRGFRQNPHFISPSFCLSPQRHRLSTTKSRDVTEQQPSDEEKKDEPVDKGLKKSVERFMKGDEEAIPSIFQAILERKLAGKGEESDDEELMKDLRDLPPLNDFSSDSDHDEL